MPLPASPFSPPRLEGLRWQDKFKPYPSLKNPVCTAIMNNIEAGIDSPVTGPCRQLEIDCRHNINRYRLSLCKGPSSAVFQPESSTNGFEFWKQLMVRSKITSHARAVGRLITMINPSFVNKNFEDSLTNWEDEVHRCERFRNMFD